MILASAFDIGSSGLLGFVLGGGLLTAIIGAYRFLVNYRMTERGLARDRVDQAVRDERRERGARQRAEREASLWQARCGDLEYALRQAGRPVPPISPELHVLAYSSPTNTMGGARETEGAPRRRRHREDDASESEGDPLRFDEALGREERDEADRASASRADDE